LGARKLKALNKLPKLVKITYALSFKKNTLFRKRNFQI
jgi:hypothetical protein